MVWTMEISTTPCARACVLVFDLTQPCWPGNRSAASIYCFWWRKSRTFSPVLTDMTSVGSMSPMVSSLTHSCASSLLYLFRKSRAARPTKRCALIVRIRRAACALAGLYSKTADRRTDDFTGASPSTPPLLLSTRLATPVLRRAQDHCLPSSTRGIPCFWWRCGSSIRFLDPCRLDAASRVLVSLSP